MRVTRITIDADLGLIELQTGPGGDGNYVLLPIDVPPTAERYLRFPGEPTVEAGQDEELLTNEAPYSGLRESAEEARGNTPIQLYNNDGTPNGTLIMPSGTIVAEEGNELYRDAINAMKRFREEGTIVAAGGWSVPKDQAYDFNTTPGQGAYDAVLSDPPKFERSGYLYPGSKAARERELNNYLAADTDECDGNCGAHPVKGRNDDVWTRAPGEGAPSKERHTGPATITNPIRVFADEHSRGYRLHSPALPGWRADINQYDLYKVPGMIREALVDMGSDHAINYPVTITVMEEEQ